MWIRSGFAAVWGLLLSLYIGDACNVPVSLYIYISIGTAFYVRVSLFLSNLVNKSTLSAKEPYSGGGVDDYCRKYF